jgi:hypothetical protein
MQRAYRRYEDVEFIIAANNTSFKIQFPDIPQLRSDTLKEILVCSLRVFTSDECPSSFNQNPLLTEADLAKCFLTLYVDGEESIFRIPLLSLRNTYVGVGSALATNTFWSGDLNTFDLLAVDWTKSYVTLSSALTTSALSSILFAVGYIRCKPGTIAAIQKVRDNAAAAGIIQNM